MLIEYMGKSKKNRKDRTCPKMWLSILVYAQFGVSVFSYLSTQRIDAISQLCGLSGVRNYIVAV